MNKTNKLITLLIAKVSFSKTYHTKLFFRFKVEAENVNKSIIVH